jgi:hypothetical protein
MKRFSLLSSLVISAAIFSTDAHCDDATSQSIIQSGSNNYGACSIKILRIDDQVFWGSGPQDVPSGIHKIWLNLLGVDCQDTRTILISCETDGGYIYSTSINGCTNVGRRMDFPGAQDYWAKIDEAKRQKALGIEADQYRSYKDRLASATTKSEILRVIDAVTSRLKNGVNRDDPEDLIGQAKAKLAPILKAEADENARLANVAAERKSAEAKQVVAFRKTIEEGTETNCGPAIEVKPKLIKVSFAVSNYGNEHWIKRDQLFPASYGCRFVNGEYQPPL